MCDMHGDGCMRVRCWAPRVELGKCPHGCEPEYSAEGKILWSIVQDCSIAPGVGCTRCGAYWIPAIPAETLAAMRAEYEATFPWSDAERVFGRVVRDVIAP